MKIKSDKRTGKAARLTTFENGWTIETWWDAHCRDFCTQVKDSDYYERDPESLMDFGVSTLRAGTMTWAKMNHEDLVKYFQKCFGGTK